MAEKPLNQENYQSLWKETKKNQNQAQNFEKQSEIIEKLLQSVTQHIESENKNNDSADRILDTIHDIADSVQQEFEELIGTDSNKKTFVRNLSKIFTILLNTNYNTAKKVHYTTSFGIEPC